MRSLPTAISFALAAGASAYLFFGGGRAADGVLLALPFLVAMTPLAFPLRPLRVLAALALCGYAVFGWHSIGAYYLPSAIAMIVAAAVEPSAR